MTRIRKIQSNQQQQAVLNVIRFLHKHHKGKISTNVMDKAAKNGHVVVLRWLHQNPLDNCSHVNIFVAAANGHCDILEFLASARPDLKCNPVAALAAATNGFFHVVKWLQQHDSSNVAPVVAEIKRVMMT